MTNSGKLIGYTLLGSGLCTTGLLARLSWSNTDLIIPETLLRPFISVTVLCLALMLMTMFVSKRALAIVPVFVFLFFTYGGMVQLVLKLGLSSKLAFVPFAAVTFKLAYLIRNVDPIKIAQVSCLLLVLLAGPFSYPMIGLFFQPSPPAISKEFGQYADNLAPLKGGSQSSLPDIIYIIPDRYGSTDTLKSQYNLENSAFYKELKSRQFSLNFNALANYPTTAHSIASTQNSGYLDNFANTFGTATGQLQPLYRSIDNSVAQRAIHNLGYRFINAGSWWDASRYNANADENFGLDPLEELNRVSMSEVENILWRGTPLREFFSFLQEDSANRECRRIKRKLEWLSTIGNDSKPVFVLAHMTVPHTPIVADQDGNCLSRAIDYPSRGVSWAQFKKAYSGYVKMFNKAIIDVFDRQQTARGSNGRKLVFVIQSDEGPYPETTRKQLNEQNFVELSSSEMKDKLGIINAIHLGGHSVIAPEELRTPINNWRIILEHITGTPVGRLEHKIHIYRDHQNIHEYQDVTDQYLN